jgi:hypothetical protein
VNGDISILDQIRNLEEWLLKPEIRSSPAEVAPLLADDFIEFGGSGRIYNKEQIIQSLQHETPVDISIHDFQVKLLAPQVALATYRVVKSLNGPTPQFSLRSSIWTYQDGRWQMGYHQRPPAINTRYLSAARGGTPGKNRLIPRHPRGI